MCPEGIPIRGIKLHGAKCFKQVNFQIVLNLYEGYLKVSQVGLTFIKNFLECWVKHRLGPLKSSRRLPFCHSIGEASIKVGLAAQVLPYPRQNTSRDPHVDCARRFHENVTSGKIRGKVQFLGYGSRSLLGLSEERSLNGFFHCLAQPYHVMWQDSRCQVRKSMLAFVNCH